MGVTLGWRDGGVEEMSSETRDFGAQTTYYDLFTDPEPLLGRNTYWAEPPASLVSHVRNGCSSEQTLVGLKLLC